MVAHRSFKKFFLRILLVCITWPSMLALFFLLPYINYLALNITITVFAFIGALEVRGMLKKSGLGDCGYLVPALGATLPVACYFVATGLLDISFAVIWFAVTVVVILVKEIIIKDKERLREIPYRISASLLVLVYPGLFLSFLSLMTGWTDVSYKFLFFVSIVYFNDTLAYMAGKLFGRGSELVVSPNKSIAGFSAGLFGSVVIAVLFYYVLQRLFPTSLLVMVIFGIGIGIIGILGDLVESALKRSASVKDSGTIMVGRGGILDSIDSLLLSAPFFYLFFEYIL